MGKIKQKRHTLHLSAPKTNFLEYDVPQLEQSEEFEDINKIEAIHKGKFISSAVIQNVPSDLFKNVLISPDALKQKLPVYSAKDRYNQKVRKTLEMAYQREEVEQQLRKKYGRKKIPFCEVVSSVLDFLKKKEKKDKKKSTAILGNYRALKDALPDLDQLMKDSKVKSQEDKPRAAKSFSTQEAEMIEDMQTYQGVLKDSQFASDPFGTITAQLKQKLQSGLL